MSFDCKPIWISIKTLFYSSDVGCSTQSDISKEMDDMDNQYVLKWNKMPIPEIWEDMKQMKLKADLKKDEDYKICYGKDLLETEETHLKPLSSLNKI